MKTYGTATLVRRDNRPTWEVKVEPHVALRLKRVFPRLDKLACGTLYLCDSPEVSRDLEWFAQRYPIEITPRDYMERQAVKHRSGEVTVQCVLSGHHPRVEGLKIPLRKYQQQAVSLATATGSLLLADDVGLGKTAAGIGLLATPGALPAVVVTMTHLPTQWAREIERFCPSLRVFAPKTTNPDEIRRHVKKTPLFAPDVYLLGYSKIAGWADTLAGVANSVIFDEVQELRHDGTAKYKAAAAIRRRARYCLGLSATPIHNYGGEIWNVMDVIRPDSLGTKQEFGVEWCSGSADPKAKIANPSVFGSYLRDSGLMLRRTRADVGRELPELTIVRHEIEVDDDPLAQVGESAAELARLILSREKEKSRGERMRASEELSWMLRQATGVAKAKAVADFVRMLVDNGEQVLLYGWHHEVYAIWNDRLSDLSPAYYTGGETTREKEESLARFKSGEAKVLVMSLRAGAGVDGLQGIARTVVFGELDWSPAVHEQAIGRLHRDGQGDPVVAYFLVAPSGSDPVVADVLGLKKQQIDGLRDPDAPLVEKLTVDPGHMKRLAEAYLAKHKLPVAAAS